MIRINIKTQILLTLLVALVGCNNDQSESVDSSRSLADANDHNFNELVSYFDVESLVGEPKTVACTLSEGTKTQCLSVTLTPKPASFEIGPWCPRNIADGNEAAGIWLDDGKVYDADGVFIQNLAEFYGDDAWQMFDPETGAINVTDTEVSCRAAARPDVDPQYQNHCVECQIAYLPKDLYQTYVIPLTSVKAKKVDRRVGHDGVGIAFSGARLDASAPVEDILSAHTLAPFDDCGGHVNPNVGYHIHAVTDCLKEIDSVPAHAAQIGLALDGYSIHSQNNKDGKEPTDLDSCRGHITSEIDYHYHVGAAGSNEILGCHSGEVGCVLSSASDSCDASQMVRRGPPPARKEG